MKKLIVFITFVMSFQVFAKGEVNLFIKADKLGLDFSILDPKLDDSQKAKVVKSAAFFSILQEKVQASWMSEDGDFFCIKPDGGSPVPENIIEQAKKYDYVLEKDVGGKKCGTIEVHQ